MLSLKTYRFLFCLCVVVVFILAIIPLKMPQIGTSFDDKINHVLAFLVLYIVLDKAYDLKVSSIFTMLITYGFFIEFVQSFLPYRTFSLLDLSADALGLIIGIGIQNIMSGGRGDY